MPLIQSKSKKALNKNIETEMKEHPDKKSQDLAVAFSVQRKNKRKKMMAEGGPVSAKTESRPMPSTEANDKAMVSHNSAMKAPKDDSMTSQAPQMQASRPKMQPLSRPRMAQTDAFKVKLRDQEEPELMDLAPAQPTEQPESQYDEESPKRSGPKVHPLKMMAKGGMINEEVSMDQAEEDHDEHPAGLESDDDMMGDEDAMSSHMKMLAEGGAIVPNPDHEDETVRPDRGFGKVILKAEGGEISPEDEIEEDHHDSIAAAIMARKERQMRLESGSEDEDHAEMYAEGGQVDIDENAEEQPNMYYRRNQEALKENYDSDMDDVTEPEDSNEHGHELSDEDAHDMISTIRRKMSMKRQFSK